MLFSTSSIYFLLLRLIFIFEINAAIVRFVPNNFQHGCFKLNAGISWKISATAKTIKRFLYLPTRFKHQKQFEIQNEIRAPYERQ